MTEAERYCGAGYATLLKAFVQIAHHCPTCGRPMRGDPDVWLWQASVLFRTAEMLEAGENPWTVLPAPAQPSRKSRVDPA